MAIAPDRIDDLETILYWEGEIDNQRIRELLGVKPVWASRLLAELATRMGERAFRETSHSPLRLNPIGVVSKDMPRLDDYMRVLNGHKSESGFVEDARMDLSIVSISVFTPVVNAIRNRHGIRIIYRSMTHPEGHERVIYPHAIVRAPRRWHVRAWCDTRHDFRDFTLGRIAAISGIEGDSTHHREDDEGWNDIISFNVLAHPGLTLAQQKMIAEEYFPGARSRKIWVRRCLTLYILQDLNIAVDADEQVPPEFQLYSPDANCL